MKTKNAVGLIVLFLVFIAVVWGFIIILLEDGGMISLDDATSSGSSRRTQIGYEGKIIKTEGGDWFSCMLNDVWKIDFFIREESNGRWGAWKSLGSVKKQFIFLYK